MRTEATYLVLRLDAPLQSWGSVAMDPVRPTHDFPTRSALVGLLASALGWRYLDGERINLLQSALRYAVREETPPRRLRDYQTADLGRIGQEGWTRWGLEKRGGASAKDTHLLEKFYLADGVFTVVLTLLGDSPVQLSEIAEALRRPSRPLFLGRKSCPPASPILVGQIEAPSGYEALKRWPARPLDSRGPRTEPMVDDHGMRCWYADGDGPDEGEPQSIWDRRDFVLDRFGGDRRIRQHRVSPPIEPSTVESPI